MAKLVIGALSQSVYPYVCMSVWLPSRIYANQYTHTHTQQMKSGTHLVYHTHTHVCVYLSVSIRSWLTPELCCWCDLLPLKKLYVVQTPSYLTSRANPIPKLVFLIRVVMIWWRIRAIRLDGSPITNCRHKTKIIYSLSFFPLHSKNVSEKSRLQAANMHVCVEI